MAGSCAIHNKTLKGLEDPKRKHLMPMSEGIWNRINNCAEIRKKSKKYNESTYKKIIDALPKVRSDRLMYHLPCYQAFTSLPKPKEENIKSSRPKSPKKARTRKSSMVSIKSNERGVLPKICLICIKKMKRKDQGEQKLRKVMTDKAEIRWKKAIKKSDNDYLIALLGQEESDYPAQEVHYHQCCKENFIKKQEKKTPESSQNETSTNEVLATSLSLIQDQVLNKGIPVSLTDVYDAYSSLSDQKGCPREKLCRRTLLSKVQMHFEASIAIMNPLHRVGFIIYGSSLCPEDALRRFLYSDRSNSLSSSEALDMRKVVLKEAPCIINNKINDLKSKVEPLPPVLTEAHFKNGMCANPPLTSSFNLYVIAKDPLNSSEKETRIANSITSAMIYNATKGYIKPTKHLQVGVGIKSITGSEKVGCRAFAPSFD